MKELWHPSFLYCLKLFNVEEDAFAGALLSCLNGCFQKIIWDINRLVKTVRWLGRDIRVRFPHIVEAIFSSKENSWCNLLTDTVARTEILIYPYLYSAHRAERYEVIVAVSIVIFSLYRRFGMTS